MNWTDFGVGAGGFATLATMISPFISKHVVRLLKEIVGDCLRVALDDVKKEFTSRFDANDKATTDAAKEVSDLKVKFAQETGGNSGGFRQAINATQKDVAELKGAFTQHIIESNKP